MNLDDKKKLVTTYLEKGILLDPTVVEGDPGQLAEELLEEDLSNQVLLTFPVLSTLKTESYSNINWSEFDKALALYQKGKDKNLLSTFLDYFKNVPNTNLTVALEDSKETDIIKEINFKDKTQKIDVTTFISHFNIRYRRFVDIMRSRTELQNLISIRRISQTQGRTNISLIGAVMDKIKTKNGNILLVLEDPTGKVNVLVNKNSADLFNLAEDIGYDETIGVSGSSHDGAMVFANNLIWPDIPLDTELRKSPNEDYAVFISDIHLGSTAFLKKEFLDFLEWIKGNLGSRKQRELAQRVKYLFILGDLVEGVGIYPGQEEELLIKDIVEQYGALAQLLSTVPKNIKIIVCSGNHDAVRIAEPQPPPYTDLAKPLYDLPNLVMVSNPSTINIGKTKNFQGFNILIYHGYSFTYYADTIESIRLAGGLERVDLIAKYLLKRRHLAPAHGSALYVPGYDVDPLFIEKIPDLFVSGHVHRATHSNYRNITILNCSCWISQTKYQEKVGLKPQPAKAAIVNLNTRKTNFLSFLN
ncbi:metallophosphoesterase [Candidatus Woesearchaeota archaeon]|nr:metallophosphoesterase [Candidatus Woesearchaeota archaeon]